MKDRAKEQQRAISRSVYMYIIFDEDALFESLVFLTEISDGISSGVENGTLDCSNFTTLDSSEAVDIVA